MSWWSNRRKRREQLDYARGYEWAAGEILRTGNTQTTEAKVEETFDLTAFDDGALAAISRARALGLRIVGLQSAIELAYVRGYRAAYGQAIKDAKQGKLNPDNALRPHRAELLLPVD